VVEPNSGLTAIETVDGDLDRAARLASTYFEPARNRLGAAAWDAAVRDGAGLSWDEAVAYGLKRARRSAS
jgi:hypothetical protein